MIPVDIDLEVQPSLLRMGPFPIDEEPAARNPRETLLNRIVRRHDQTDDLQLSQMATTEETDRHVRSWDILTKLG